MRFRRFGVAALTGSLVALSAAIAVVPASAVTPIPGRIYGLADIAGTDGDLFRTTTSNSWSRLTSGLSFPESVSASPDGSFAVICATLPPGTTYRIYRVPSGGGSLRNLIGNRQGCGQSVSPDGRKVAYVTDTGGERSRLNVVGSNGGTVRTLYRFASSGMYDPVWAAGRIFFERRVTRNPSSPLEIYSVRARDGKKLRRHTNHGSRPIGYGLRDVSPDGKRLLIAIDRPEASLEQLSILTLKTRRWRQLRSVSTAAGLGIPDASFSPSTRSIAMIMRQASPAPNLLWIGDAVPGAPLSLLLAPPVSTDGLYSIDWARR